MPRYERPRVGSPAALRRARTAGVVGLACALLLGGAVTLQLAHARAPTPPTPEEQAIKEALRRLLQREDVAVAAGDRAAAVRHAGTYCGAAPGCGSGARHDPAFYDHNGAGGDCTNFVSQALRFARPDGTQNAGCLQPASELGV